MHRVLTHGWRCLRAFAIIYSCLLAGNAVSVTLPLAIPGTIIGMLILFALLCSQLVPSAWVRPGCQLLLRYMILLFVPVSVGIMNYADILRAQFAPIVVSSIVSTLLVLLVVSVSSQWLGNKTTDQEERHD